MFQRFCNEKTLSESTIGFYKSAIKLYETVSNDTLDNLIKEADNEEEQGIRWKNRKIKERLIQYRNYLFANKSEGTAKRYITAVKTVYSHFEIELQSLPTFNSKQIDKTYVMDYDDLLTRNELIDAYYEANNLTKCLILFGISSGLSKIDMLNLTVGDFITACEQYTTKKDLLEQLTELREQNDVIPCFKGERQKTHTKYVTFCSPEAVEHIVQYLIGRDALLKCDKSSSLQVDHKLFDVSKNHVSQIFRKINNKLELGKVGKFVKFRCHQLRKFHASTLLNSEIVTWTVEEIDTLQGRSMDSTHRAYFKNSNEKLFKKYYECVDELMLFKSIHEIDKEAYDKLEQENNFYKTEISKNEQKMEEQQQKIEAIIRHQNELEEMLNQVNI